MTLVTRFAPSPSGYLHLGHAFSALTGFEAAQTAGGRFILRIEDIDATRCRPEYEAAIYEDLSWLGLAWEQPVRRQSEHMADYHAALDDLREQGLIYRCFRTRRDVLDEIGRAPHGPFEAFTGTALPAAEEQARLAAAEPYAWRLSLGASKARLGSTWQGLSFTDNGEQVVARPEIAGDIVLARKDVGVAYHLAVVVDDALQGINQIIRGVDLAEATHIQRLLQTLLALPTPQYRHHPLKLGADGKRLAKRDKAQTLRELRAEGAERGDVLRLLAAN